MHFWHFWLFTAYLREYIEQLRLLLDTSNKKN
jgi:hypothetical protein